MSAKRRKKGRITGPALVLSLLSSDSSEATAPTSVTIPAGQLSATFTVTAVDDPVLDGNQTVSIIAYGAGVAAARGNLTVQDEGPTPWPTP